MCGARLRRIVGNTTRERQEGTAVQTMTMTATRQLVADHQAALGATDGRGLLRRVLARANGRQIDEVDIAALEHTAPPAPAVILAPRPGPYAHAARIDKVA